MEKLGKELVTLEVTCIMCNSVHTVTVNKQDFTDWRQGGKLIQDVMPYLSASDRELLISRVCINCWDNLFPQS